MRADDLEALPFIMIIYMCCHTPVPAPASNAGVLQPVGLSRQVEK